MLFGTLFCDNRLLVGSTRISFSTHRHLTSQSIRWLSLERFEFMSPGITVLLWFVVAAQWSRIQLSAGKCATNRLYAAVSDKLQVLEYLLLAMPRQQGTTIQGASLIHRRFHRSFY